MKNPVRTSTIIAITAASLFAAACGSSKSADGSTGKASQSAAGEKAAKVHCQGVNDCKGQGGCKSAANACSGQNGCKGQSFVEVADADACKAKGGTVAAM